MHASVLATAASCANRQSEFHLWPLHFYPSQSFKPGWNSSVTDNLSVMFWCFGVLGRRVATVFGVLVFWTGWRPWCLVFGVLATPLKTLPRVEYDLEACRRVRGTVGRGGRPIVGARREARPPGEREIA